MRIDVRGSDELRDIVLAINQSDKDVQRAIRVHTQAELTRPWGQEVLKQSSTQLENRVLAATTVVSVSNQNIRIQSAGKGRRLSGGLIPKSDYHPVEFGAKGGQTTYQRKGHTVRRNTRAQFKPFNRKGYVFYPAARRMIPRLASLWVQTVVKTYADILDGKG